MKAALKLIVITSALFALTGCQMLQPTVDDTQFILLNAQKAKQGIVDQAPLLNRKVTLLPVQLPKYLSKPHVVTRNGNNNIDYSGTLRWAEPLKDGIARVIVAELETHLGSGSAYLFPYHGTRDKSKILKLRLYVLSFEVVDGKNAILQSRWEATANDDRELVASGHGTIKSKVSGHSTDAYAQAMSACIHTLADNIAQALSN